MMFMIPIPPTIERDRRDRAEHDVEDRLGVLLLLQQQLRHGDLEIGDVVVPALQHAARESATAVTALDLSTWTMTLSSWW